MILGLFFFGRRWYPSNLENLAKPRSVASQKNKKTKLTEKRTPGTHLDFILEVCCEPLGGISPLFFGCFYVPRFLIDLGGDQPEPSGAGRSQEKPSREAKG